MSNAPSTPIVVLTPEQLETIVKRAVHDALAEHQPASVPALLDRNGLAHQLGVGTTTVDRLRREGLPCAFIGDSPRFDLAECVAWIRKRAAATPTGRIPSGE